MDPKKLKKPPQLKEAVWRQHLSWLEVVSKQVDENIAKRQRQIEFERNSGKPRRRDT